MIYAIIEWLNYFAPGVNLKYFVELYGDQSIGVLQPAQYIDPNILDMFLADDDCFVVDL